MENINLKKLIEITGLLSIYAYEIDKKEKRIIYFFRVFEEEQEDYMSFEEYTKNEIK